jgi:hypothetical protein
MICSSFSAEFFRYRGERFPANQYRGDIFLPGTFAASMWASTVISFNDFTDGDLFSCKYFIVGVVQPYRQA